MIVYNVQRKWFTEKADAETLRKILGLKPSATLKLEVNGRRDLVMLLNALCEPPAPGKPVPAPATEALVERAYVPASRDIPDCVPDFLLKAAGITR